jgi:DNA polymerase I-like protein with 3'-5' exonuclease and polymerase domains
MLVRTIKHGKLVLNSLRKALWLTLDTETQPKAKWAHQKDSTLIFDRHQIKIFSICYRGIAYSFPTNCISPEFPSMAEWAEIFTEYFTKTNPKVIAVLHNYNYDRIFQQSGFPLFRNFWDTMISGWLANANEDKSLKARAPFYGRYIRDTKTINFDDLTELADYAEGDVVVTDEIFQQHNWGKVVRPQFLFYMLPNGMWSRSQKNPVGELIISVPTEQLTPFDRDFLRRQEFPVLRSTMEAENRGVPLDRARLLVVRQQMIRDLDVVTKKIYRHAGKKFSINSAKQKVEVLEGLGLEITKVTKGGAPSVNFDSMLSLQGQHPIIADIMEYSKIEKLRSTYIGPDGFEYYYNDRTGCIHPSFNTVGAVTGRFSSSNPNFQNIPSRNDRYGLKECLRATPGRKFICMDFSQIELRIMALLSKDHRMSKVLNDPEGDIHQETSDGLKVPRDPNAKQCNFLLIFGGGAYALQTGLRLSGQNVSEETCQQWIDLFDSLYPNVKAFREHQCEFHRKHGFIYYLTGRKRVIEDISSPNRWKRHQAECQLANNQIQGSAQDLMKALIVRASPNRPNFDRILSEDMALPRDHRLILRDYARRVEKIRRDFIKAKMQWHAQVHDEVLHSAHKTDALDMGHHIAEMMTWRHYFAPISEMSVAIRGDGGVGDTWAQAKKPKEDQWKIHL